MELSNRNPSYHAMHLDSKDLDIELHFASNDPNVSFYIDTLKESSLSRHVVFGGVAIEQSNSGVRAAIESLDLSFLQGFNYERHVSEILNEPSIQKCLTFMVDNQILVHHHELYLFNSWVGHLLQKFQSFIKCIAELKIKQRVIYWLVKNHNQNNILLAVLNWFQYMECNGYDIKGGLLYSYAEVFRGELRTDLYKNKGAETVQAISCLDALIKSHENISDIKYDDVKDELSQIRFEVGYKYLFSLMMHSDKAVNFIRHDHELIQACEENDQFATSDERIVFFENQYPYGDYNPKSADVSQHPAKKSDVRFYTEDSGYIKNMQLLSEMWVNTFSKFCDSAKFADPIAYIQKLERYDLNGLKGLKNLIYLIERSSAFSRSLTHDYEAINFRKTINMDLELLKESIALTRRIQMQAAYMDGVV